uniref:Uncharacterized protein n=1 Tax=Anguilla anguilla TaxID=7936 RepID=A0A0E9RFX8_ANGAN
MILTWFYFHYESRNLVMWPNFLLV